MPRKKLYQIIYADPPWEYSTSQFMGKRITSNARHHYPTMSMKELKALKVEDIADPKGCLMFMWTSSPHLAKAIDLMEDWGFKYITIGFIWDKKRLNPGHYTMSQCEVCIIGKLNKIPQPRGARNIRQLVSIERTRHSQKPGEVRDRIKQMFPTQKAVELFARKKHKGWAAWGNEVKSQIKIMKQQEKENKIAARKRKAAALRKRKKK